MRNTFLDLPTMFLTLNKNYPLNFLNCRSLNHENA